MGTRPEFGGIIFPSGSGWMPEEGPLLKYPVPRAALPWAQREDIPPPTYSSEVGRDHLPEQFRMAAHDRGIFPPLGFSS